MRTKSYLFRNVQLEEIPCRLGSFFLSFFSSTFVIGR